MQILQHVLQALDSQQARDCLSRRGRRGRAECRLQWRQLNLMMPCTSPLTMPCKSSCSYESLQVCARALYANAYVQTPGLPAVQTERQGLLVKTLKVGGAQSILSCGWSPQGTPLVSCDKAGAVTFWAAQEASSAPHQHADDHHRSGPMRQTR